MEKHIMEKKAYTTPQLTKLDVQQTKSGPIGISTIEDENYSTEDIDPS